jgi:hypothetical protein
MHLLVFYSTYSAGQEIPSHLQARDINCNASPTKPTSLTVYRPYTQSCIPRLCCTKDGRANISIGKELIPARAKFLLKQGDAESLD